MRLAAVLFGLSLALPASAQSVMEQAQRALTELHISEGHTPDVAASISTCFIAVMDQAEAAAIIAAPLGPDRTQAASMMRHYIDGISCATAVFESS